MLRTLQLETLTERKVKAAIADKLGEAALRQFEAVVSDELEKLLQDLADHSDEDEEEQENVQGPPAKKAKVRRSRPLHTLLRVL